MTDWIVFGMNSKKGNPNCEHRIRGRRISVVVIHRRVTPCGPLNLSVEVMEVFQLPDFSNVDLRIFGDLLHVTFLRGQSMQAKSLAQGVTYLSNSAFMLVPIAREYTSKPRNDRCRASEPTSRFHGLESTIAAFRAHSEPSSPMY